MMVAAISGAPGTAMEESTVDDAGRAAGGERAPGARLRAPSPAAEVEPATVLTFADFYDQNRHAVVAVAYGLSGSRWAAEELAHDAFLAALRRWDEVAGFDNPAAWITRVVVNRAASRWRRLVNESKAMVRLGAQRRRPLPELEPEDDRFWARVRSLPKRQAQAITLHYLEDLSVAEIAGILGCAEATVRVHLHRGRVSLAQTLGIGPAEEQP